MSNVQHAVVGARDACALRYGSERVARAKRAQNKSKTTIHAALRTVVNEEAESVPF